MPVLVVSGTHDPKAQYENGLEVAFSLGNARLLSVENAGHGDLFQPNAELETLYVAFLDSGDFPSEEEMSLPPIKFDLPH